MPDSPLTTLLLNLFVQSMVAIGGVNVILAELHRVVVVNHGWLTELEFANLFALAQAAPGPNMLFVTVIGWHMAGVKGALLATAVFLTPPLILAGLVARLWNAWGERVWFVLLRRSLVPLTVGLMVASAWLLANAAAVNTLSYVVTAVAAAASLTGRIPPVLILAVAALAGIVGLAF